MLTDLVNIPTEGRPLKLSMKGDYGLRALLDLAQRYGEGPVQSGEIALRQQIPEPYLDHLLTVLRKGGVVKSIRGPQGGHSLARAPQELTLAEVLGILEGSVSPMSCVDDPAACGLTSNCVLRDVWRQIGDSTRTILETTTIGELARRQREAAGQVRYYI
jgi:Rrf2 family protein